MKRTSSPPSGHPAFFGSLQLPIAARTVLGLGLGALILAGALQLLAVLGLPLGTCPATFENAATRVAVLWVASGLIMWLPGRLLGFDSTPLAIFWALVALGWWAYPRLA